MKTTEELLASIKEKKEILGKVEMKAAIERLNAERIEVEREDYEHAVEFGRYWAKELAEWKELAVIAGLDESDVSFGEIAGMLSDEPFNYDDDAISELFHGFHSGADLRDVSDREAAGFVIGAREIKEAVDTHAERKTDMTNAKPASAASIEADIKELEAKLSTADAGEQADLVHRIADLRAGLDTIAEDGVHFIEE